MTNASVTNASVTTADTPTTIPTYTRSTFVSRVYRSAALIAAGATALAGLAGVGACVSLAAGCGLAISSFWALERTLAMNYGGRLGKGRWSSFALAAAKYALLGATLFVATRVAGFRMGYMATGLVVVYAAVVVTTTRDMIQRGASRGEGVGSGDMV